MRKQIKYFNLPIMIVLLLVSVAAESGLYLLGLGIGNSNFHLNQSGIVANFSPPLTGSSTFNDSATAFSFYGAKRLDEYLTLEADLLISGVPQWVMTIPAIYIPVPFSLSATCPAW